MVALREHSSEIAHDMKNPLNGVLALSQNVLQVRRLIGWFVGDGLVGWLVDQLDHSLLVVRYWARVPMRRTHTPQGTHL